MMQGKTERPRKQNREPRPMGVQVGVCVWGGVWVYEHVYIISGRKGIFIWMTVYFRKKIKFEPYFTSYTKIIQSGLENQILKVKV